MSSETIYTDTDNHFYTYLITDLNPKGDAKYYIGSRSWKKLVERNIAPEDDTYMGSPTHIEMKRGLKERPEDFEKIIIDTFNNRKDTLNAEKYLHQEYDVENNVLFYNKKNLTSDNFLSINNGYFVVMDDKGVKYRVNKQDPRYISGELKSITTNKTIVKDIYGNILQVQVDDPRLKSGELVGIAKDKVSVKDKEGNTFQVSVNDPMLESGDLRGVGAGTIMVKDSNGNSFRVSKDDPRWISGELKSVLSGRATVVDIDGNTMSISVDDPRYVSGELKHNNSGMVNVIDSNGNTFKTHKDDPRYISGELISLVAHNKFTGHYSHKEYGEYKTIKQLAGVAGLGYSFAKTMFRDLERKITSLQTKKNKYLKSLSFDPTGMTWKELGFYFNPR